jgi:hypothetical protein
MKRSALLFSLALGPLAIACAAEGPSPADGPAVDDATAARVTPGNFKLYGEPHTVASGCDVHTKLALTADGGSKAHLEEAVGGMCAIAVRPNPRDYRLRAAGGSCGSKIFTGSQRSGATIKITDHRTRMCEDVIPALIVVEETIDGQTTTRYSGDAAASCDPSKETNRSYIGHSKLECAAMDFRCDAGKKPFFNECGCGCEAELAACVKTGCSGQICAEGERFSKCDWRAEYACYREAVCERQADGQCGFTETAQLQTCLGR